MRPGAEVTVYLCVAAVDMRKQAATLALVVEQALKRGEDRLLGTERPLPVDQATGEAALHLADGDEG